MMNAMFFMEWICNICGYVYEGEDFEKEGEDFICPLCDAKKEEFHKRDVASEVALAIKEIIA